VPQIHRESWAGMFLTTFCVTALRVSFTRLISTLKLSRGVPAVASVREIDGPVDAAVILVPAAHTLKAFEECCQKGIKFIVIESAGFAETGEDGKNIEKELRRLAETYHCRFVGPNCSGIINTHHQMVQSIGTVGELRQGNIGLIGSGRGLCRRDALGVAAYHGFCHCGHDR